MELMVTKTWFTSELIEVPDDLTGDDLKKFALKEAGKSANSGHLWEGTKIVDRKGNELVNYLA